MTTALDLGAIKSKQQRMWASGDYAAAAARIHPIAELLVEAADLRAGSSVLDVATGSGNAALAAARCGCRVTGVDYVPDLAPRTGCRSCSPGRSWRSGRSSRRMCSGSPRRPRWSTSSVPTMVPRSRRFEALSAAEQESLHRDLVDLCARHNRAGTDQLAIPSTYLESIMVRI